MKDSLEPVVDESKHEGADAKEIWGQDEFRFHGQRPDESVMLVKRQHVFILLPIVIFALVTVLVAYLIGRFTGGAFRAYTLLLYIVVMGLYLGHHIYGYYNTLSILTNQRIIHVLQKGFFSAQISEAELSRIQDVSSDIKGVLETMFGYGDVTIRTASKDSLLVLKRIDDPYDVQQAIVRALKDT